MKKIDLAYMAGVVDGEGSITVSFRRRKQYGDVQTRMGLTVYNSDFRMLEWIKARFGGSIHITKRPAPWKDGGAWHGADRASCLILEKILPFLVIKKEQAKTAIRFQRTKMSPIDGCKNGLPARTLKLRKTLISKLKQLNKRGK